MYLTSSELLTVILLGLLCMFLFVSLIMQHRANSTNTKIVRQIAQLEKVLTQLSRNSSSQFATSISSILGEIQKLRNEESHN